MFFPYPLETGETLIKWSIKHLAPTSDEAMFLAFLSLYGSKGVLLSNLISFARLRTNIRSSKSHWLLNGEVGPILRPFGASRLPNQGSFLDAFVRETSDVHNLRGLEDRLVALGLIEVKDSVTFLGLDQNYWHPGNRLWCIIENRLNSHLMVTAWHGTVGQNIIMELLYVFTKMPSKDVSLLAERYREGFYSHSRNFILETLRFWQTSLKDARESIVALILQLLTHRSQHGDEELFQVAKACPSSVNGFDWTIMVLWAELKRVTYSERLRFESALNNRIIRLLSWKGKRQNRTNGLTGYLLVEWLKAAEPLQDSKLNSQIFSYAMDWVERAWYSGSSIEHAALCCVLANFRILDKSVLVPPNYHCLYGYYLSRASHLEQAQEFLSSGIKLSSPPWDYLFELVSVLVRLGRRQEAEAWLAIIKEQRKSEQSFLGLSRLIQDREHLYKYEETKLQIYLYEVDLLMAAGELDRASSRLENIISIRYPMDETRDRGEDGEDDYLRSLLLAFQMRLLEVRPLEDSPERALKVATELMTEVRNQSSLEVETVQWIMQQLLTLSNRLVWAGNVTAASSLLELSLKVLRCHACSDSIKDLLQYTEERMNTVSNLLISDRVEEYPTTVGLENKAVTKQALHTPDRPSSEIVSLPKKATSESDNIIAIVPHNNPPAAVSNSRNDPWRPMNETSSGLRIETKLNTQDLLNRQDSTEELKASDPTVNGPTEKAPLAKLTAPPKTSRRGPNTKKLVQRRLRNSVAAMLRRAPRAPTTELANPVLEHSAPVRRFSELRTA